MCRSKCPTLTKFLLVLQNANEISSTVIMVMQKNQTFLTNAELFSE